MRKALTFAADSILAGIAIAIGGTVYLRAGGIGGAILFSFGLITVVNFKWKLFTGVSGFVENATDLYKTALILLGNIAGCFLTAAAVKYAYPATAEAAGAIVDARIGMNPLQCILMGCGCGLIMTVAVYWAKYRNTFLPLLFGVPTFILCGFFHSIADAYYIALALPEVADCSTLAVNYASIVGGNFIGCNLIRIFRLQIHDAYS